MLHHPEPGDRREDVAQFSEGLAVAGEQGVEQLPSPAIGKRPEHVVIVAIPMTGQYVTK